MSQSNQSQLEPDLNEPREPKQEPVASDLPDFDEIEAEYIEPSHMEIDGPDGLGPAGVLTKDQFYMAFASVFDFSGLMLQLQSLPIQAHEQGSARAASDAIYEVAEKSPWLSFLIEPSNEWVQRALVVGTFAFGKAMAVSGELNARNKNTAKNKTSSTSNNNPGMEAFNVSEKP
ncbi:hypothetical protein [Cohaesibacter celericrescens]|uniref:Uncharacterized protein n=1 Tax=Cohaesibacter celericrescens TaxID=2067669 RepID=A0A2N5XLN6_9HYPH|nr:hypothetical protein [Cohaesibacter celericrescens]PLW75404.1 hypothetical protein C0081_20270 [Cohaesibacter celericrescens]